MQARAALRVAFCVTLFASEPTWAASYTAPDQGLQNVGQGVAIALPVVAAGISIYKDDWNGVGQLVLATGATVGTSVLLSHFVKEDRPYCKGLPGCDNRSFPSDTAALAFAPAQYLWNRYGWEYGVPAYAAAGFVGATRIISKEHWVWDVATSGVISLTYNWIITGRYQAPENLYTGLVATPHGAMFALNYRF